LMLQIVAGIILALPNVVSRKRLNAANNKIKNILRWPLNNKRGLLISVILFALLSVLGFFGFSIFIQKEPALEWYDKTSIIILYISLSFFLYIYLFYNFLKLIGNIDHRIFSLKKPIWSFAIANFISFILFLILLIISFYLFKYSFSHLDTANIYLKLFLNITIVLLIQVLALSSLCFLYSCAFFVFLSPLITLLVIASPIKKPLWIMVIVLFVTGGILLVMHSLTYQ
jgi:hypothetical protein